MQILAVSRYYTDPHQVTDTDQTLRQGSVWILPGNMYGIYNSSVQYSVSSRIALLGFFVKWHINLYKLFNAKAILLKEQ